MHKSRLAGFIIDCNTADLEEASRFWSAALGYPLRERSEESAPEQYRELMTGPEGLHIEVQRVGHPSRVHLDIETDDIEAEVQRLEALGARRVERGVRWWIMEAPTGQRFCVVRPQKQEAFAREANSWT
ncbi:putative enzyme related to lactoylglutathione lyase [Povalibacter uvarum]|uniref:Putative enzyme related to lactoylglutathione lyase n=1 Tax=Povalibacter uvarum TaxID=732238 RepID=A0A841HLZ8_9GAMM|nr:VOC family protein [Povalibacter uvarum]MBB6093310.1 putative enzyme related to lactoylglutathione lyase [Povalibacter uvarum]